MLGSFSATNIEEVAEASKSGLKWMHIHIFKDRELTKNIICRAEKAGFRAIVVTVDEPGFGKSIKRKVNLPPHISFPVVGLKSPVGNVERCLIPVRPGRILTGLEARLNYHL